MVVFNSSADLEPNQEKYQAFMKSWGKANQDNSRELSKTYPNVITLTVEYRLSVIKLNQTSGYLSNKEVNGAYFHTSMAVCSDPRTKHTDYLALLPSRVNNLLNH